MVATHRVLMGVLMLGNAVAFAGVDPISRAVTAALVVALMLSARRTRCVLEHWVLVVEDDAVQVVYRDALTFDPAHFLAMGTYVASREELVVYAGEDCASVGTTNPHAHVIPLVR